MTRRHLAVAAVCVAAGAGVFAGSRLSDVGDRTALVLAGIAAVFIAASARFACALSGRK